MAQISAQIRLLAEREKGQSGAHQMGMWVEHVLGSIYQHHHFEEAWSPAVNIYESDAYYCVVVDLAGVRAEEIDVQLEDGAITITGLRPPPEAPESSGRKRVHLMEIDHGPFVRRLELPNDVDVDAIEARYRGGFLWIRLGKRGAQPA